MYIIVPGFAQLYSTIVVGFDICSCAPKVKLTSFLFTSDLLLLKFAHGVNFGMAWHMDDCHNVNGAVLLKCATRA